MSVKRKDTPEARKFWAFVERTAREVRANEKSWERDARLEREQFEREHVYVTCQDCNGCGYRSWVNQLGCIACAGNGGWYERRVPAPTPDRED